MRGISAQHMVLSEVDAENHTYVTDQKIMREVTPFP
jgi:hypothetical protein